MVLAVIMTKITFNSLNKEILDFDAYHYNAGFAKASDNWTLLLFSREADRIVEST